MDYLNCIVCLSKRRSRSHWDIIILHSMPSVIYHISVTIDIGLDYNEIQASSLIFTENKIKALEPTYFMHLHNLHITSHSVIYLLAVVCR